MRFDFLAFLPLLVRGAWSVSLGMHALGRVCDDLEKLNGYMTRSLILLQRSNILARTAERIADPDESDLDALELSRKREFENFGGVLGRRDLNQVIAQTSVALNEARDGSNSLTKALNVCRAMQTDVENDVASEVTVRRVLTAFRKDITEAEKLFSKHVEVSLDPRLRKLAEAAPLSLKEDVYIGRGVTVRPPADASRFYESTYPDYFADHPELRLRRETDVLFEQLRDTLGSHKDF